MRFPLHRPDRQDPPSLTLVPSLHNRRRGQTTRKNEEQYRLFNLLGVTSYEYLSVCENFSVSLSHSLSLVMENLSLRLWSHLIRRSRQRPWMEILELYPARRDGEELIIARRHTTIRIIARVGCVPLAKATIRISAALSLSLSLSFSFS